VRFNSPKQQ
jgi:hypothetical protein